MYNLTNLTNANNYLEIIKGLNETGQGAYVGVIFLAMLFIILFITFKKGEDDTKATFLTASLITAIVAVLFWGVGLITWHIMIYPFIFTFAGIVIVRNS